MALHQQQSLQSGFTHARIHDALPDLPQGYDWESQLKKYFRGFYWTNVQILGSLEERTAARKAEEKGDKTFPHVVRLPHFTDDPLSNFTNPRKIKDHRSNIDKFVGVFCHRGLYDRAMKILENSSFAIQNGLQRGLHLHEIDARLGPRSGEAFVAHDEVAARVTSKDQRWSVYDLAEIWETALVTRRFDVMKSDFASSFQETDEKVPELESLLGSYRFDNVSWDLPNHSGCTFQIDLRGDDFARAIARYSYLKPRGEPSILLKGYNITFTDGWALKAAIKSAAREEYNTTFDWADFRAARLAMIMVFYTQQIIALAMNDRGMDANTSSPEDCLEYLTYEDIFRVTQRHIYSFLEPIFDGEYFRFIPEIVHSGLGPGYNKETGQAVNPLDGSSITDPEVILESRIERAMIEVSLHLRERYPTMIFSSCTRLCEVKTPKGDLVADMKTGRLKLKPTGQKGISTKLREIHGGLFPQSHMVVADDPFAEIAARTWIDEYAKLNRRQLLEMNYDSWLAQARQEVVEAVNKLNGPFLPNTFDGPLDDDLTMADNKPNLHHMNVSIDMFSAF